MNGLSEKEALKRQEKYGLNILILEKKSNFFLKLLHCLTEPMFLLLLFASIIYFILGEAKDGITMLVFVVGMIGIDVINEYKTDKTLKSLKELSSPKIEVLRDNKRKFINSSFLVPGDIMYLHEGEKAPADGKIIKCSSLAIDESSLTGESIPIWKSTDDVSTDSYFKTNYCYASTLVIQGTGTVLVEKTGLSTEYGKIGKDILNVPQKETSLQKEVNKLISVCAFIALFACILVAGITFIDLNNYHLKQRIIESILSGVTLAMAMIPEEFPVVLTVFLSMGAWRLAKKNSLVKKMPSIETLGSVSVLCVDKTGTITQNKMTVDNIWTYDSSDKELCKIMGMCCQEETYDPMEKAILNKCKEFSLDENNLFNGIKLKEYAFSNESKLMGTIWDSNNEIILGVKGSSEGVLKLCKLDLDTKNMINDEIADMSKRGLRVIAVASKKLNDRRSILENIDGYNLNFLGLVGFIDPPRKSVITDIKECNEAGIRVIMITGDNGMTAKAIADAIKIPNSKHIITGEMLRKMSDDDLKDKVYNVSIFSRVLPSDKMRIVKALKKNKEVVAMTGDGVNDAPALKYADIGIAMGKRGSEVSREAADLILLDDNFSTIVDTVKDGRRIYDNIKKAIGYILIIHIPIILSSIMAPLLKISTTNLLFLPIHIVLMELIIDPTSSIIFERQPADDNIMKLPPRKQNTKLVNLNLLGKSISQGLVIFLASFMTYYYFLSILHSPLVGRTIGISIIILANLFLVLVNSSDEELCYKVIPKILKDKVIVLEFILTILILLIGIYSPLHTFLKLSSLSIIQFVLVLLIAFFSVFWYEAIKFFNKL